MKKIFLIMIVFLLIGSVCASQYSHVSVNGVDFEIPSKYSGGTHKNSHYVYKTFNDFGISCVDEYIVSNYGGYYDITDTHEKTAVADRPCMFLSGYNSYSKTNVSYLYFPVNESVYCLSYEGNNITSEISHVVESSPGSDMDADVFYGLLEESRKEHDSREYIDQATEDNSNYVHQSNHHNDVDKDDDFIKWYLLTRLR